MFFLLLLVPLVSYVKNYCPTLNSYMEGRDPLEIILSGFMGMAWAWRGVRPLSSMACGYTPLSQHCGAKGLFFVSLDCLWGPR